MGRNAKLKRERKQGSKQGAERVASLPTNLPHPLGKHLLTKQGKFCGGEKFNLDVIAGTTGKFLLCLDISPKNNESAPVSLAVYNSFEQAILGGEQAIEALKSYTHEQLQEPALFEKFLSGLGSDEAEDLDIGWQEFQMRDGTKFTLAIEISPVSGKYLTCLRIKEEKHVLTVWDTPDRAKLGAKEAIELLKQYTTYKRFKTGYYEFMEALSDDDDTILGVLQNGSLDTSMETRLSAMRQFNEAAIEKGSNVRFRIDGETII